VANDDQWWYDLKTKTVVSEPKNKTKATDRLGPYNSRAEAERALEKVEERNEAWEHDPRWSDDD
jgi:hypothetical protein